MKIRTFTDLKKDFEELLEKSKDRKFTIENELQEVTEFVKNVVIYNRKAPKSKDYKSRKFFNLFLLESNMLFKEAFNNIIQFDDYKEERSRSDTDETFLYKQNVVEQAFEFVEYFKWLRTLLKDDSSKSIKKSSQLSHKQKLLALHYLGFDFSKYDNTKLAKILSEVLELNADNTRQYLSYLAAGKNYVRTKNNLEVVEKLFENQGLNDVSSIIQKDIEKL